MADGGVLSAEEKQAALDTVADLIASTIDGARGADVHAALSRAPAAPGEWRALVQREVMARRDAPAGGARLDWDCPQCGARCTAVDARSSLRSASTAGAVRELSEDEHLSSLCPFCGESMV